MVSGSCASPGSTTQSWTFAYDGDGNRVSQAYFDGTSTLTTLYFFGGLYETTVETSAVKKYYAIAGQIVAMNDGAGMKYLLTDHLGSVVAVTNASGSVLSQTRYLPFGQVRTDQFAPGPAVTQTDFAYTGQRNVASLKLMDYHARFYDAAIGRFIQPDTIIPGLSNPQTWNRYSYVYNDPIGLLDPSGHAGNCGDDQGDYGCRQRLGKQKIIDDQGAREARSVYCSANPEACTGWSHAAPTLDAVIPSTTGGIGGRWAVMGNASGAYPHGYGLDHISCFAFFHCSAAEAMNYDSRFDYPFQLPWKPVENKHNYSVMGGEWFATDSSEYRNGAIYVTSRGSTITNTTDTTHFFCCGTVSRTEYQDAYGNTKVLTVGQGNNSNWLNARVNEVAGEIAFTYVDFNELVFSTEDQLSGGALVRAMNAIP